MSALPDTFWGFEMNGQNVDDGFAEAAVRALSKSLLDREAYNQLTQANNLADFTMIL